MYNILRSPQYTLRLDIASQSYNSLCSRSVSIEIRYNWAVVDGHVAESVSVHSLSLG